MSRPKKSFVVLFVVDSIQYEKANIKIGKESIAKTAKKDCFGQVKLQKINVNSF